MTINKRTFLKATGAMLASLPFTATSQSNSVVNQNKSLIEPRATKLTDITKGIKPISVDERKTRIAKAQSLMQQNNIAAMVLEPGASMDYFTGIQWWRSERLTAVVIPQQGDIAVVCPFFEEPSIRETLAVGDDVRVWQEHESPFVRVKQVIADRKIKLSKGTIAFESSVRYFAQQGVMNVLNQMQDISADPITRGCRMIKSQHELQLMHKANEITLRAYQHVWEFLSKQMSYLTRTPPPPFSPRLNQESIKRMMDAAQKKLGGSGTWNMVLLNEASAYPHGTKQKQELREGSVILMDCGCSVHGYQSDISRTFVFGEPSKKQQKIWNTVREGQNVAFEAAQLGKTAGSVDGAVRAYYETQGLGPNYKLPGLSHRTGHGIGMEGHEPVNFVRGETEALKPGMCFSNEPGIYLPGEFGVRLEDCVYMTNKGVQWFTHPPESLASPIGKLVSLQS
ncbi:Xaa-Pro peptidase family protein [Paraglaciecola aquimarina]|uniref:Xaa-Pro peptidase family protein n=1 Tax=Paraglaciecola algarum TaxID=3050085 RepID=A0ABS9D508_9ALTE|nr:Xaa-Pro peptidase family protein [Paraglaciecola sp. G1-23]MCF2947961.1 Xaa-Pro peptidase family protein [Paraglaciecola sp. G1-23]